MDTKVLNEILVYIDEHICEKISLLELAEIAGYSPFYFSKLFSETMGLPVTGYIRVRKLQYALCSLLEGRKVLEVSLMYAFDSHEGFTRSFTQLFGITPSRAKKYLSAYQVPELRLLNVNERRNGMGFSENTLVENMHQLVFEVIRTSLEEVKEGFCTQIRVVVGDDGTVRISDNGRGIPLSQNAENNRQILDKILAGQPITKLEYAAMGDFTQGGLQTVNSLCEALRVTVHRNGKEYVQDYVRGITQHEVLCREMEHPSGTEIVLKPDSAIFGELKFSVDMIREWIEEHGTLDGITITVLDYLSNDKENRMIYPLVKPKIRMDRRMFMLNEKVKEN